LDKISIKSQLIYVLILFFVISTIFIMPFVYVDVSVQAKGIIQPETERMEVKSLLSGILNDVKVKENQIVKKGDTLFTLEVKDFNNRNNFIKQTNEQKLNLINDLIFLQKIDSTNWHKDINLQTTQYITQFQEIKLRLSEIDRQKKRELIDLKRDAFLYEGKAISKREYESRTDKVAKLESEIKILLENQQARWRAEETILRKELSELQKQSVSMNIEQKNYIFIASINGIIQQPISKYIGGIVQAGETLCIISPDTTLIAECFISSKDIGYLQKGMNTKLQIDAFNYRDWGFVPAKIQEIGKDFMLADKQFGFKVRCQIQNTKLKLKNNYQAEIKKGMTLKAHFVVTKRSLWQLLFDKTDNWLNPKQNNFVPNQIQNKVL
jgi:membrane fusion protein, peptide pheromone/bacteriocin exporter